VEGDWAMTALYLILQHSMRQTTLKFSNLKQNNGHTYHNINLTCTYCEVIQNEQSSYIKLCTMPWRCTWGTICSRCLFKMEASGQLDTHQPLHFLRKSTVHIKQNTRWPQDMLALEQAPVSNQTEATQVTILTELFYKRYRIYVCSCVQLMIEIPYYVAFSFF
jgi:hypothetical protein